MDVGQIVWIDGNTAAIVVGNGTNADNIADGRVFVARLGDVEVIEPNDEGAYPYGAQPYDQNASGSRDRGDDVNPGGFGENSPAIADRNTGQSFPGATPPQGEPLAGAGDPTTPDTPSDAAQIAELQQQLADERAAHQDTIASRDVTVADTPSAPPPPGDSSGL